MKKHAKASVAISLLLLLSLLSSIFLGTIVLADDTTPPVTTNDYDGLWHTLDFAITLSATDDSGVFDTYYILNGAPNQTVSIAGQPIITVESATNTLEYWSVDIYGNEEAHQTLNNIELDKTVPTGSININNGDSVTSVTSVTLYLTYSDSGSGVSQVVFSNDPNPLENWESASATRAWVLTSGDGAKTVKYQIVDNAGLLSTIYTASITLQGSGSGDGGGGGGTDGGGDEASPTPSASTEPTPTASTNPTVSPTDYDYYTPEPTTTEDNGLSSSTILIIAAVMLAVLIPAALVFMNGNKGNRSYGRYGNYPIEPYYGPDTAMEPYYGPEMSPVGYEMEPMYGEEGMYEGGGMYEYGGMYEDEGMYEEEIDDEYEAFHPQYGLATQNSSPPPIASKYGRYATSLGPCPYCGSPVRGDQTVCHYCHQRIA
jgi:hypothetical protein